MCLTKFMPIQLVNPSELLTSESQKFAVFMLRHKNSTAASYAVCG